MAAKQSKTLVPDTETSLQELQQKYLENRQDKKIFSDYFLLLRNYARSLALKEIKRKNIYLLPERVDEICTDATILLLNQYRKEGWSVGSSFAGVLRWKVIEAMYKQANDEMHYSLNTNFNNDDNNKEFLDVIGLGSEKNWTVVAGNSIEDSPSESVINEVNVAFNEVNVIIDEAYDILPYNLYIKFVPWLVLKFRKPKSRNSQTTFTDWFLTSREEDAFDLLFLEIRDRIVQHAT